MQAREPEDAELVSARARVLRVFLDLDQQHHSELLRWINGPQLQNDMRAARELEESERPLRSLGAALLAELGPGGGVGSERVRVPRAGDLADCSPLTTLHVDEFLCDTAQLQLLSPPPPTHYCTRCHSRDVQELTMISHSASVRHLRYMFRYLLPASLHGKQLLDIGSRLGAVIFGAYYLSDASRIVGVEMNRELCEVQRACIERAGLARERVRVVCGDAGAAEQGALLRAAHVVVLNTVDLFVEEEAQARLWATLARALAPGTLLVTARPVPDTLAALATVTDARALPAAADWLRVERPQQMHNEIFVTQDDDDPVDVFLYRVL